MPKIEPYNSQVSASGQLSVRRASGEDFGAGVGEALQGQARTVAGIGQMIQQQSEQEDVAGVRLAMTEARAQWTGHLAERANAAQPGDKEFAPSFATSLDEYTSGLREKVRTRAGLQAFNQMEADLRGDLVNRAGGVQAELMAARVTLDVTGNIEARRNTLVTDPSQFGRLLADTETELLTDTRYAALPAKDRQALLQTAKQGLALSEAQGILSRDPEGLAALLNSGARDTYLDADDKARLLAQAASKKSEFKASARSLLGTVRERMENGFEVPGTEQLLVDSAISAAGDPLLSRDWQKLQITQDTVSQLRPLSLEQLQAYEVYAGQRARAEGASDQEFIVWQAASRQLDKTRSALKEDAIGHAAAVGLVELAEIDDPTDVTAWRSRAAAAQKAADYYGTPVQPFTAAEASRLTNTLGGMSPDEQLLALNAMHNGFGPAMPDALAQISKDDPLLAHTAGLVGQGLQYHGTAREILLGRKLMAENKEARKLLGDGTLSADSSFREISAGAFQHLPRQAAATKAAADALYVRKATAAGETRFNRDVYEQSVREVLGGGAEGGITTINRGRIVLPPGVDGDSFERALNKLSAADLKDFGMGATAPSYQDGTLATPDEIADEGRLQNIGNGRYIVLMADGRPLLGGGPQGYYALELSPRRVEQLNARGR